MSDSPNGTAVLIERGRAAGYKIELRGDRLQIRGKPGSLHDELEERAEEIKSYLRGAMVANGTKIGTKNGAKNPDEKRGAEIDPAFFPQIDASGRTEMQPSGRNWT